MKEKITEIILGKVKEYDIDKLVIGKNITVQYFENSPNSGYIFIEKFFRNSWNVLRFRFKYLGNNKVNISEYIFTQATPRKAQYYDFMMDNINLLEDPNSGINLEITELPDYVSKIITLGYTVWRNKWGYLTKNGRKAKKRNETNQLLYYDRR